MKPKAMVVDNDFFFVEFLSELLEEKGYAAVKAYDGKEGMEQLEKSPVDLMFVDLVMPKVDGTQLIAFARMKYPDRRFPIVVVSGTVIEQLDDLDGIGADYYIAKGPMEKMKEQFGGFLRRLEEGPQGDDGGKRRLLATGNLYPRRESVELLESLKFERAILESVGLGVLVVDKDARVLKTNRTALRLLGRSAVQVMNQPFLKVVSVEHREDFRSGLKTIARDPGLGRIVFSCRSEDGGLRVVVTLLSVDDRNVGWIVALEEIGSWEERA